MKFLLVHPCPHKDTINLQSFMMCEPLELEYVAALLEKAGHSCDIADLVIDKDFMKALKNDDYDVVAFTSYLVHVGIVKEYARQTKQYSKKILTLVGGVHAEVVPQDFIDENIDVVLKNGMYALEEIVSAHERGEDKAYLQKLADIPKKQSFDFPHPLRSKTDAYRDNYNYIYHDKCATLKTSFSCAYNCEFCFCTRLGKYFERPLLDVIEELKGIEQENIFIVDDNFLYDRKRLTEFCGLLDQNGIKKTFIAFGRADFICQNEDIVKMLADHGFDAFFVGIESFKTSELSDYNKKSSVETNTKAVRILEKHGLQCYSGLIVGFDWEKKDFDGLINYLNSFEHPMVNIQPITPIKGTPFYEKNKHLITENEANYHLFDMAHAVMEPQKMSKRAFYYNILRAYLKTAAAKKGRKYIRQKYGKAVYKRVRRGAWTIGLQYIKLIIKPN